MRTSLLCLLGFAALGCADEGTVCTTEVRYAESQVRVTPAEGRIVSRVTLQADQEPQEVECTRQEGDTFDCHGGARTLVLRVYSDDGLVWTRDVKVKLDECGHPAEVVRWDVTLSEASADASEG